MGVSRMGWGHEGVLAVLDEAETLPAATSYLGVLAFDRIMLGHMYELPEGFMDDAIRHAIQTHAGDPAWALAGTLVTATSRHPTLAVKYLPGVIADAEAELQVHPDVQGQANLESARAALADATAGAAHEVSDED